MPLAVWAVAGSRQYRKVGAAVTAVVSGIAGCCSLEFRQGQDFPAQAYADYIRLARLDT